MRPRRDDEDPDSDWAQQAACLDRGDLDFYSDQPRAVRECKRVCRRCPVLKFCVEEAFRIDDDHGIWGGLTAEERSQLASGQRYHAPGTNPRHGELDRYARGCRCTECAGAQELVDDVRRILAEMGICLPRQLTARDHDRNQAGDEDRE